MTGAVLVRLKLAELDAPVVEAVTVKAPAVPFAVNTDEVAIPFTSVVTVSVAVEFDAKCRLLPNPGP